MPWEGHQYSYPSGQIRRLLACLSELREIVYARGDPATETAALLWDIESALTRVKLTRRQRQILHLHRHGFDTFHIAIIQGISEWSVDVQLRRVGENLKIFLNSCRENLPSQGYEG